MNSCAVNHTLPSSCATQMDYNLMKADKFNAQINHMHTQSFTPNLHLDLVLQANLECFVCVVIPS